MTGEQNETSTIKGACYRTPGKIEDVANIFQV